MPTVHTRLEKHGKAPAPGSATEQPLQCPLLISVATNFCEVQDPGSGGSISRLQCCPLPAGLHTAWAISGHRLWSARLSLSSICFGLFSQSEILPGFKLWVWEFLPFPDKPFSFDQCFSDLSLYQNCLEGLLEHGVLGPYPQVSNPVVLE